MLSQGVSVADPEDRRSAWGRFRGWSQRRIKQMSHGDFDQLPPSFHADEGQIALEAYRTVLIAMEVVEGRRALGRDRNSVSAPSAAIHGSP